MSNERKNDKKTLKINLHHCKAMVFFFNRYFKRNMILTINIVLTPLVYIIVNIFAKGLTIATQHEYLLNIGNSSLFITYLIQAVNITLNFMIYAVNDMKQSVIFRRIGLTRINRREFFWSYLNFTGTMMVISYILITIIFLFILSLARQSNMFWIVFNWQWLIDFIISLLIGVLLISFSYYLSIILFNKMWLNLISGLSNVIVILPLFILTIIFSTVLDYHQIFTVWAAWQAALLVIGFVVLPILLSILFWWLADRQFKWEK